MINHNALPTAIVRRDIRARRIVLAGNKTAKIYGTLHCRSGKKMKIENRVFFSSVEEAVVAGFRPCGNCMRAMYNIWKLNVSRLGNDTIFLPALQT
ncbi:MAG TPA: Ada metal-binding domain-containing protein [Chryseolinea sp.]|nr:Ada metal-binding domain-containing protein [Chryseolinea sp.]